MITSAKNKQLTARDEFIVAKAKQGFKPAEILVLLEREGFQAPARSRIYQILEANGAQVSTK